MENTLLDFYKERREKGLPVSVRVLYLKWYQFKPDMTTAISYTAAQMRIYRFMERHQLSRCQATNHAQGLPTDQQLIKDFISYINDKVKMLGIDDCRVVNFDETNCYFSPDLSYNCRPWQPNCYHCKARFISALYGDAWRIISGRTISSICHFQG